MACTRWRRHKHKECPSWRLFSSSGSLYTEFEKKIMGAGLLLVSWILRASLISVILEQSEFSLAAVPGSEDLNVNVTKMAVFCPQILYFGLSSQKYQPQEIWKSSNCRGWPWKKTKNTTRGKITFVDKLKLKAIANDSVPWYHCWKM